MSNREKRVKFTVKFGNKYQKIKEKEISEFSALIPMDEEIEIRKRFELNCEKNGYTSRDKIIAMMKNFNVYCWEDEVRKLGVLNDKNSNRH